MNRGTMTKSTDKPEVKLPLLSRVNELKPLPGQEKGRRFGITASISPAPGTSMGYLVEIVGARRVKILACLIRGGDAHACDSPLLTEPETEPELIVRNDREHPGTGDICSSLGDSPTLVSHYRQIPEHDNRLVFVNPSADMGPYATEEMDVDVALAVAFLQFYQLPLDRDEENPWRTAADVLDDLKRASYPDALDALVFHGTVENSSEFEHFAGEQLMRAGAELVRLIAAQHSVELRRLSSTNLFWTAVDYSELTDNEIDTLQAVEGVLNRLALTERALAKDGGSPKLNALSEQICEIAFNATFTRIMDVIPKYMLACNDSNPFATIRGATCAKGGEWDVRTRFADTAERILAPFNFLYTFDSDVKSGTLEVHASLPAEGAFPTIGTLSPAAVRAAYAMRFAAVLASAAFGSGVGIIRARITLHERSATGTPLLELTLSRQMFTMKVVPLVNSEKLQGASLSAQDILAVLDPVGQTVSFGEDGGLQPIELAQFALGPRPRMADDTRELPAKLAELVHADRVCDLDIYGTDDDTLRDRFHEVMDGTEPGDPASVPGFTDIISAYEAADMLEDDPRPRLYCANMVSRIMAGSDEDEAMKATCPVRFRKMPDSAFDARTLLARTLRELGNFEDALRLGQECVAFAPTTFSAWHSLALTYNELEQHDEAAKALIQGLKFASVPQDIAVGYYRLAYVLWQGGDAPLGLACYAMVHPSSPFGSAAADEMAELMQESHIAQAPGRDAAESILRANGIPIAPLPALCERAAKAAIELVDGGFLAAGENLTNFLTTVGNAPNCPDVLSAVARSLAPHN